MTIGVLTHPARHYEWIILGAKGKRGVSTPR